MNVCEVLYNVIHATYSQEHKMKKADTYSTSIKQ